MTLGDFPMALLRFQYQLARLPFQWVESLAVTHLDEQGPVRLAYEQFLIDCDRAASYLLDDENAAARAADLKRHTAAVRLLIAREQHHIQQARAIVLDQQRARFNERRRQNRSTDPT
ncbi:hypothetical protein [Rhodococcus wratislaviensis]|uniref:hypothetical protein n=1 Tax=Rhodococcus wratislaviensis TaxID=44752 RepID=UPI00364C8847